VNVQFLQVDVFTAAALGGNPLAVFPEGEGLSAEQMQAIAHEMNLSETTFVMRAERDSYDVRIFTPAEELPFAGHPTIGTAWVLRHLGRIEGDELVQHTGAGDTIVRVEDDLLWFERSGTAGPDLGRTDPGADERVAGVIGLPVADVGLEARELGRPGLLRPAFADIGLEQLMVPVRSVDALGRCMPRGDELAALSHEGVYCFTALGAGRLQARGFFPGLGIAEDPATGSAAAALGIYLATRVGDIEAEIAQGIEMGRPSRIFLKARSGSVQVGGRCELILTGTLDRLP
jgi:trans-2,3-dihydro-3-hydroxyanthranilate isomerase